MNASKETTLNELADMLSHVVEHMVTKDDIRSIVAEDVRSIVAEELAPILAELRSIRRELDDLREKVENVFGFRKEIDHALERIVAIEQHLKIDKKTTA